MNRTLGKALHRYEMISHGDRILVGVSGGKDSLTLLWMLNERRNRIPIDYHIHAAYVDPGFSSSAISELATFCERLQIPLTVEKTNFGPLAHGPENRENPCFLCSRKRRQRLFEVADSQNCRKLALGHNKDDIIETVFLNMAYAGEISTMRPVQSLFKGRFTLIRPLAMSDENLIRRFAGEMEFPVVENPCPSATGSKRMEMKQFLEKLYRVNPKIKGNIFRSLGHVKTEYLLS